jgi:ABC-type sugar transport system substrate-binding protein
LPAKKSSKRGGGGKIGVSTDPKTTERREAIRKALAAAEHERIVAAEASRDDAAEASREA